jgi:hypothetical protein
MAETAIQPMRDKHLENLERSLKWEKRKIDRAVQKQIIDKAELITDTLLDIGISERNPNVLNSLLDRAFGKARQNIGIDGGAEDKPVVFLPAELMLKHGIRAAEYKELHPAEDDGNPEPSGMLVEPIEEIST